MSSANDHLLPPPKPRVSPLEFRNTDLVSRLLAATPPYLYNMSLLPNTYFFSEMLRSIVQAKAERTAQTLHQPMRRSRKRNWNSTRMENLQKAEAEVKKEEKQENPMDWLIKSNKKQENPLELTNKTPDNSEGPSLSKSESFSPKLEPTIPEQMFPPSLLPNYSQETSSQNLVLPPPPPMWYPPLYPAPPYGIDPLHFFIDLRVSGHIYDKKHQKDSPPSESFVPSNNKDKLPHTEVSGVKNETEIVGGNSFKQSRHSSAFSVPVPHGNRKTGEKGNRSTKFDVKSMGFDKNSNRTSTNYVMNNITSIYRNINSSGQEDEHESSPDIKEETSEDRERKLKDLRATIGLELMMDCMKPKLNSRGRESYSSTDVESVGSPALEVVAVNDEN